MLDCLFCRIAKKEIPAEVVYEDADFLAFLDIHPRSPGHTLVIPKRHYRWVWQVPEAGTYFEVVKKIALAQQKTFRTEAIWSRITGDEIPHAHIWIFPHPKEARGDKADLKQNARQIRENL